MTEQDPAVYGLQCRVCVCAREMVFVRVRVRVFMRGTEEEEFKCRHFAPWHPVERRRGQKSAEQV